MFSGSGGLPSGPRPEFILGPAAGRIRGPGDNRKSDGTNFSIGTLAPAETARAQHTLRDRPAVDLGGAVVDAERADFLEQAGDDRIVGDAETAEYLHAAIDDAPDRLGADHLGHARFV